MGSLFHLSMSSILCVIYMSICQRFVFNGNYSGLSQDMNFNRFSQKGVNYSNPALRKGYFRLVEIDEKQICL